MNGTNIEEIGS